MNNLFRISLRIAVVLTLSTAVSAQAAKRSAFDVTNYVINAELSPVDNKITATADVTFIPTETTRSVSFELNGSLKVDEVTRIGSSTPMPSTPTARSKNPKAPLPTATPTATSLGGVTFVQDQAGGSSDLGPHVRVDLPTDAVKGTSVTLRFKYNGVLNLPTGGPLLNKRLAYIGENNGYLMYAARWFPFHDYAADPATADITISLPPGFQVAGYSEVPLTGVGGKFRFVQTGLVGNLAYGKYVQKNMNIGGYDLQFFTRPGNEPQVINYAETLGKALEFYTKKLGDADFGKKLIIVQIDDESLDYYSSKGMLFMADKQFEQARDITTERIQREAAYQWWGLTVGLKSFDDAWLSQGLAECSAYALRESLLTGAQLDNLRRELLEKSLTFEQTASLLRAPANLDDQSTAYQYIMYGKGAFVFKLLRDTLGEQKFNQLLRTFLQEYRGKNASIDEFEKLATRVHGENLRYFFARWVESTGVPEFSSDYLIIRTRGGKFVARGTIKQNYDNLKLPVEVQLRSEGENGLKTETVQMDESTADFNIESTGKPLSVIIDPNYKLLRISPDLRVSSIARRGIERFKEGSYAEAQAQFEEALKLDRSNSWIYYHLGLLFLEQRNYDLAIDNFKAALGGTLSPAWLSVWSNIKMGNAYDAKGDRNRAVSAYKRAENLGDNYDNAQEAVKRYQATPYDPKESKTTAIK